jgi:hypothetical protein
MTRRNLSTLVALRNEEPKMLIRILRILWPDIRAALDRGHTLKVIHESLGHGGIAISYRQFCAYVARLRREQRNMEKGIAVSDRLMHGTPAAQSNGSAHEVPDQKDGLHDPHANVREHLIRNRPGFNYDDGLPDKNKLIG